MKWNLSGGAPIYLQLMNRLKEGVVSGEYPPGERLPSVRELAGAAGVNPNTMQRALSELEREGLVESRRTAGRFVTEDEALIEGAREELALRYVEKFREAMAALGCSPRAAARLLLGEKKEEEYGDSGM